MNWIKRNILDIIQILPLVGAIVVAVLAFLQHAPWYLIALSAFAAFGLTFWGINQYAVFRERHKKVLTQLSDKEIEDTIRNWLDITSFSFQRKEAIQGLYFAFEVKHGGLSVHIERQYKEPDVIILAGELHMNPKETPITLADWEKLGGQISVDMARLGIQWKFVGEDNKWEKVRLLDAVLLDDSSTGFYFRQKIMFVVRSQILVFELFKECLRQVSQRSIPDKEDFQTEQV